MQNILNCTLIIPSHNRHEYLERIFEYYKDANFDVVCCDSSEKKYDKKIPENIKYSHLPSLNFKQKMFKTISEVNTEYIVCCADDDFVLKNSIQKGIEFLNLNSYYNSIVGKYVGFFKPFNSSFYSTYNSTNFYIPTANNPTLNVQEFMSNYYMILWGLYRKESILKAYEIILNSDFRNDNFIEFIIGSFLSYSGNIKHLDLIWGVREIEFINSWGRKHKSLCIEESNILQNDINSIEKNFDLSTEEKVFCKAIDSYMKFCKRQTKNFKTIILDILPINFKSVLYKALKKPLYENNADLLEINNLLTKFH
ncbi:MAG: TIGR00180 family glycosyltransferase [Aliarcobacter skirrowii]|uniref:TIGR00180 family glycosyltransferase n=1 Tax=Aliarcobacter skirrowii TaxID=28200 RepID=UPI00242E428F|nr:TIGR00180 family glycosyltransferase [Aliarcobacter skirrowii]MDD2509030.1 TIGR00180 family glycosyltransferase [Aliarcobacter skirrowii]MDD3497027.1 TIGR00180 family glycosyltransferase [Aliarcobacter skirrowii]